MAKHASHASKSAAVAPIYGNSVLLGKRIERYRGKPVPFGGYWSIFGGSMEPGESPMICAARELEEETKIKIQTKDLRFVKRFLNENSEFIFYFVVLPEMLSPILNYEHTEWGWFRIDSLNHFPDKIDFKIVEALGYISNNSV